MPFQISFNTRPWILSQVKLISAGDDQYHVCSHTINLEAVLNRDSVGHAIEWEQLWGTPVTLINSNTLTPHFAQVDNTDKMFRVWVDKGTPYQQYDDVIVWKTPTSLVSNSFNNYQSYYENIISPPNIDCDAVTHQVIVHVPAPSSIEGEDYGSYTEVVFTWNHPTDNVYSSFVTQYEIYENDILVDSIPDIPFDSGEGGGPPTDTLEYHGFFEQYSIKTKYNIAGVMYEQICIKDYTNMVQPYVKVYNDSIKPPSFNSDQQYFSIVNYSNIVLNNESSNMVSFNNDFQYFSIVNYSNLTQSHSSHEMIVFNSDNPSINITRYDPSGIGS